MKIHKIYLFLISVIMTACCLSAPSGAHARQPERVKPIQQAPTSNLPAPALIPGTRPEMNTAGFWIGRHPFPDKVILDGKGIQVLNENIRNELKISYDLSSYPATYSGEDLIVALRKDYAAISRLRLYLPEGTPVTTAFLAAIHRNMQIEKIQPKIAVTFGFITTSAEERVLPLGHGLFLARYSHNFDRLQNSSLDMGTPIAIVHTSADRRWHYVVAPLGEGWVESSHISVCPFEAMKTYLKKTDFVVITAAKGDIYLNREMTAYHDRAKMGQRFPLIHDHGHMVEVSLPSGKQSGPTRFISAFIRKKDINIGYLTYTPRTILLQAFEFLNNPYGWGDMNGEQDCSSFIRNVFATVGIELPRNSLFQSKIGQPLNAFTEETPVDQKAELLTTRAAGGIALLKMTGHIMLYLGACDGVPYSIHDMYGYHDTFHQKEFFFVVNRIVVTNLNLGKDTRGGPYLKRINRVRIVE